METAPDPADHLVLRALDELVAVDDDAGEDAPPLLAIDATTLFPDLAPGAWMRLPYTGQSAAVSGFATWALWIFN